MEIERGRERTLENSVSPCLPQVVERLEADLGVKVQQLKIPQLKYSFQIWSAMMGAPGKDGKVCIYLCEFLLVSECLNV
jgi:hypothetical protein